MKVMYKQGPKDAIPKMGIGRRCGAIDANVGGYRSFMAMKSMKN